LVLLLAQAEAHAGAIEDGLARISAFLDDNQPVKQHWLDAELYRQRGLLLLRRTPADTQAAETAFRTALSIARRQETKTHELRAAVALAGLWQSQGKCREAIELLAPAYGWFTEGLDVRDRGEVLCMTSKARARRMFLSTQTRPSLGSCRVLPAFHLDPVLRSSGPIAGGTSGPHACC
jgi:predicted ATPase